MKNNNLEYKLADNFSILIPTFNEEMLLPRALESAKRLGVKIFVLDSFSTDDTVNIAKSAGCSVHQGQWGSFSEKMNWGLKELPFDTTWVMRLDADEYFTEELIQELESGVLKKVDEEVGALWIGRRIFFLGKWIKHGGMNSQPHARIMRVGKAKYEPRLIDEHVQVEGKFAELKGAVVDDPARGLLAWMRKHLLYAETECYAEFNIAKQVTWTQLHGSAKYRRFLKEAIYLRMPLFVRPFGFWAYKYIFLLGFLDGIHGLIYHFLHAFWYRFVIDALIFEGRLTKGASVKQKHVY